MKTLERRLGLPSVIAISIAAMLGSGLFVLPGIAAIYTGPSVWLAYMVAGICVLPAALSKSELATAMPESGGTYVYLDRTFGPLVGTVAGLGLWMSLLLKSAFALVGFGAYLTVLADVPLKPVALGLLVVVVGLNVLGVRKVGKVQSVVVVLTVVGLVVLAGRGSLTFHRAYLDHSFAQGTLGFWTTVSFVYISYAGVTKVAAIAEEVENPGRNLPLGILVSLGLVTTIYGAVTLVLVGNVPMDQLRGDTHPIYTAAHIIGGEGFGNAAAVLGVITMTSMANSGLLAASRFPFAMSRNQLLPRFLSYVSTRFMTPVLAIGVTAGLMAAAILLLDLESIAKLASSLMIVAFVAVNLAVIVLRESSIQWYKPDFRSPFYPYVQIVGIAMGLGLLLMLGFASILALVAMVVPGVVLFFAFGTRQTDRKGVLGRFGPRRDLLAAPRATHIQLPSKASVVVPLLGKAYGAESLAELGDALGGGAKVEVVHIRDMPPQIALDTKLDEDPIISSLRRRIKTLAQRRNHDIEFDSLATHDHIRVVHEISRRVHCEWVLMEWRGGAERGVFKVNPLGWLADHLSCNLALFKDVGSREVAKILVYAEPGPHDALVAITADHLSHCYDADLTFARFVPNSHPDRAVQDEHAYMEQLSSLCTRETEHKIVRGDHEVADMAAFTAHYDLMLATAPPDVRFWSQLRGHPADQLMARSACSVLRLKAPRSLADRSMQMEPVDAGSELSVGEFLVGDCVQAGLEPMSKQALFTHIAGRFAVALEDVAAEVIENSLWERERAQNTAIGDGLAVPHGNLSQLNRTYAGIFTTLRPVDYRAPDDKAVDVFFVTLGPPAERNVHLRLLSALAKLVTQTRFLTSVRAADNASELLAVVLASSTLHNRPSRPPQDGGRPRSAPPPRLSSAPPLLEPDEVHPPAPKGAGPKPDVPPDA